MPHAHHTAARPLPTSVRRLLRLVLFVAGLSVGVALSWLFPPDQAVALDASLVRGVLFGVVVGLAAASTVRTPGRRMPNAPRPRPGQRRGSRSPHDDHAPVGTG